MNRNTDINPLAVCWRVFLCFYMFLYPRHSSRRIRPPEPPEGRCIIYTTDTGLHCTICTISNFSGHFHFLQIWLDGSNCHIFPAILQSNKESNRYEKSSCVCDLTIFYIFPAIYSTYNGLARKNRAGFSSCARMRIRLNEFSPNNICLYIIAAAQDRHDGSNRLWVYITQGGYKLGSNWHRWRDMAMVQSAIITCLLYIIQTSYQPTTAHYLTMEKCVNVHKYSM